jgi:hypothetical protein
MRSFGGKFILPPLSTRSPDQPCYCCDVVPLCGPLNPALSRRGPTRIELLLVAQSRTTAKGVTKLNVGDDSWPPLFHITQWKAGSEWIHQILARCCQPKKVWSYFQGTEPVCQNNVYAAAYLTKEQYKDYATSDSKYFVVLRDPRDILVSGYYSLRFSHFLTPRISDVRQELESTNVEDGMLRMMDSLVNLASRSPYPGQAAGRNGSVMKSC